MIVDIREIEKVRLKNAIMIEGFPGIGMIGTISASYLADKLGMRIVGYISSSHFPPIAAIHDFVPVSPARIYASEKHNLVILFSEFVIPSEVAYALSQRILKYAKEKGVKEIYSLAGIASDKPTDKIYGIGSSKEMVDRLKKAGVEVIKEGATQGVSGLLIAECASEKFPAANLLVQTSQPMEPKGSAKLLAKLSELIKVPVDVKPLIAEGDVIEEKIRSSMDKIKDLHQKYNEMGSNPAYA
ncbi:MAG TPA: PAC2 family protein [Candidatus Norongarragalinales archaeon]|nr:PAC2 family protein [Candidatus Norongarragalinales archaeon]